MSLRAGDLKCDSRVVLHDLVKVMARLKTGAFTAAPSAQVLG
jgi:hypothetical protein